MNKNFLIFFLAFISIKSYADPYLALNFQNTTVDTIHENVSDHDFVTGITLGGLNVNPNSNNYMKPSWELSLDFGENTFNKLHEKSYRETLLPNFSVNFPLDEKLYFKVGLGVLWRNIVLVDGTSDEEERILNLRTGLGYRIHKNLLLGVLYDTSTNAPSFQIGYLFSGTFK